MSSVYKVHKTKAWGTPLSIYTYFIAEIIQRISIKFEIRVFCTKSCQANLISVVELKSNFTSLR
jgi:hypothetical protein